MTSDKHNVIDETRDEYWDAADHDPFKTAKLYSTFKNPERCGHTVPLDRMIDRLQKTSPISPTNSCPVCGENVLYIEDGMVSKHNATDFVTFKYGKIIYRLSVPPKMTRTPNDSGQYEALSFFHVFWKKATSWPLVISPTSNIPDKNTAQGRIATVLRIDCRRGLKVLSKGKVVYPLQSSLDAKYQTEDQISKYLIDHSNEHTFQDQGRINLLVVGTPIQNQSNFLEKEKQSRLESTGRITAWVSLLELSVSLSNVVIFVARQFWVQCITFTHFILTTFYQTILRPWFGRTASEINTNRD